jgi:ankyrin repeat protein
MIKAIEDNDVDTVKQLVLKERVNLRDALVRAIQCYCYEIVQVLLDAGADVNAINKDGHCPLETATCGVDPKFVELLLRRGASVNCSINGTTGLSSWQIQCSSNVIAPQSSH